MKKILAFFFVAQLANMYPMQEVMGHESDYDSEGDSVILEYLGDPIIPANLQPGEYTSDTQLQALLREFQSLVAQDLRDQNVRDSLQALQRRAGLYPALQQAINLHLRQALRPDPIPLELE